MSAINGEGDNVLFCLVHVLKFDSDTATSKNIAIINFGLPPSVIIRFSGE